MAARCESVATWLVPHPPSVSSSVRSSRPRSSTAWSGRARRPACAELWLWEDCFLEGGLTTATAALAWSEQLRVGVGLLPVPLRNPALTAMELATVARLWPGRLVATLGHGVADWMAQVGGRSRVADDAAA